MKSLHRLWFCWAINSSCFTVFFFPLATCWAQKKIPSCTGIFTQLAWYYQILTQNVGLRISTFSLVRFYMNILSLNIDLLQRKNIQNTSIIFFVVLQHPCLKTIYITTYEFERTATVCTCQEISFGVLPVIWAILTSCFS